MNDWIATAEGIFQTVWPYIVGTLGNLMDHPERTVIWTLVISAVTLFTASNAARVVYPFIFKRFLRLLFWAFITILRAIQNLLELLALPAARKAKKKMPHQKHATVVAAYPSRKAGAIVDALNLAPQNDKADEWVVAALTTMGFSKAEAKAAAAAPAVAAETEWDDQVRVALQQMVPRFTT